MPFAHRRVLLLPLVLFAAACGRDGGSPAGAAADPVPPFELTGELEGLHLVWFDREGLHAASRRDEVPEAHRERVRVESLAVPPAERLDPSMVWLADLRAPGEDGRYPVRAVPRETFEALADAAAPAPSRDEVVLYSASWCDACRAAGRFLRSRDVPFVEKDVEKDPDAHAEMRAKLRAAGLPPAGIPVIDVRGTVVQGFDPDRLAEALARGSTTVL